MGFLCFLLRLPFTILTILWEAILYFMLFLSAVFKAILWLFSPLIGDINWNIPKWYPKAKTIYTNVGTKLTQHRHLIGGLIILITASAFIANYTYHWYLNRPKPIVTTPIEDHYHSIKFYHPERNDSLFYMSFRDHNRSPAPLDMIGKEITEGISISPTIEGTWKWSNNKSISFSPKNKWPLGQEYTVKIDESKLLADHEFIYDSNKTHSFITSQFHYSIVNEELYLNPKDPNEKKAIFKLQFNYPVNKAELEKRISLALYEPSESKKEKDRLIQSYQFTMTYQDDNNTAYIHSENINLRDKVAYLTLSIDKGVTSTLGGPATSKATFTSINVPDRYSLVISDVSFDIVEKEDNKLQQVLIISSSHNISAKDLAKSIKVLQLPHNDKARYTERYYDELEKSYKTIYRISDYDIRTAKPITLKAIDTELDYQNQISFELSADQNEDLYIQVNQPLIADGGYALAKQERFVVKVPEYKAKLDFAAQGSVLSLSGEQKLPLVTRNLSKIKLQIERIIPSQLQHLVAFNYSYNFSDMDFGDMDSEHFVEKFEVIKTIEGSPQDIQYSDIDLSEYLIDKQTGEKIHGAFIVHLSGLKPTDKNKDYFRYFSSRFILTTDIGIINKKSLDQSYDVFAQSITSGKPIENAKVSVIGTNGIEITSVQTDKDGHAHFSPLSDYYEGIRPLFFVVEKDRDLSFLPIRRSNDRQLNFSRFDIGGTYESLNGGELKSHLFSDRGVYRPGDTFNIGMIVRTQDWNKSLEGMPLMAIIYDPKYNEVKNQSIYLSENGFNELSYTTSQSSPTGNWYIDLYLIKGPNIAPELIGSTSVVIREFEPDKTKVSLKFEPEIKEGWVHPDALKAVVDAQNLFGTPAQDRVVESQLILQPSTPYFAKYDSYNFYQNITQYQNSFNIEMESARTDKNGQAVLSLPIKSFEGNYTAKLLTDVFEPESGRSVAATTSVFISRSPYLVGGKADGRLDYIKQGSVRKLDLIAIDPNLNQIALNELTLVKLERKYLSVLVKQPSGVYKYESKKKDIVLSETPFAINKDQTIYSLDNSTPGNYIIQVKNSQSLVIYQTSYSVAGTGNITRNLDRNAELVLKINKTQYKAGDEIEVAITAPYTGSGIITIERDKVYAWKWFKSDTNSSIQKITLPEDIDGNAYINVQFVRNQNSDEIFMSPLSYGVVPFKISNEKFDEKISLSAPTQIKPGDILPITIKTNSRQSVVVFATDEGILQVSNYKLKDPLNTFLRKRALSVRTSQIMDLILPEFSRLMRSSAPGGGDNASDDELSGHLNPFKRKVDKPVAYWSGIFEVNGEQTVNYQVPDYFNGKIRIMAVSVGRSTMGHAQTKATVRNDFVLNPNIPYFVAPNDEFEISLNVANNLESADKQTIPLTVTLNTTPHLAVIGSHDQIIKLSSMDEGVLKFKLKATDKLGSGDMIFTVTYGDKSVTRKVSTSVRPISQYRVQTIMGRMDGSSQTFDEIRDMYQPFSERTAAASYSPLLLSKGLSTYLENYPHYCSEQIVSRAIPILIANKYPDFELSNSKATTALSTLFNTIQNRQNGDGAIGLWRSTYHVYPYVTLYAVNFMLEARDAGENVPNSLLKNANKYVKQIARSSRTDRYGLRLRAYATYLLTRQNIVTTSYLASIMEELNDQSNKWWKTDLTAMYLASSYKMLKMEKEANKLFKPIWNELSDAYDKAWWNANFYDPLVINSAKIYLISKHFPEKVEDIPPQALENLVIMLNQNRYTTQSSAMTILALDSYITSLDMSKLTPDSLTVSSKDDQQQKAEIIARLQGLLAKAPFTAKDTSITFKNNSDYPAWYVLSQKGFDKTAPQEPVKRGLEVYREFTDEKGNPIDHVKLGDKINVTVRIRTVSKEGATNIAIVDLLPGGFEVVQQPITSREEDEEEYNEGEEYDYYSPIAVGDYTWYPDYTDIREDRVIIYGSTENNDIQTFSYQIKATNVGEYSVPPAYGEAMYDRDIQAISKGGQKIIVEPKE